MNKNICKDCEYYVAPDKGEPSWNGICLKIGADYLRVKLHSVKISHGVVICGSGYLAVDENFGCVHFSEKPI